MSIDESVGDHFFRKLRDVNFIEASFPCFSLERPFPDDFYAEILRMLPASKYYRKSHKGGAYGRARRRKIKLSEPDVYTRLTPSKREFWREMNHFFSGPEFLEAVLAKFAPCILQRYSKKDFRLSTRLELVRDTTHYRITPHTDQPKRMVAILFYLPRDDSCKDMGTSIYQPIAPNFKDEAGTQFPVEEFKEIYRAPFTRNSAFGFLKTDRSFHGRELIQTEDAERHMMICNIQHAELANAEKCVSVSVPDCAPAAAAREL